MTQSRFCLLKFLIQPQWIQLWDTHRCSDVPNFKHLLLQSVFNYPVLVLEIQSSKLSAWTCQILLAILDLMVVGQMIEIAVMNMVSVIYGRVAMITLTYGGKQQPMINLWPLYWHVQYTNKPATLAGMQEWRQRLHWRKCSFFHNIRIGTPTMCHYLFQGGNGCI